MRQPDRSTRMLPSSGEKLARPRRRSSSATAPCRVSRPGKGRARWRGREPTLRRRHRLDDTPQHEPGEAVGQGRDETSRHEGRQAPEDEAPSSEPIRQRVDDQLAQSEGQKETAEEQSQLSARQSQLGTHPGKGRQDDVRRQVPAAASPARRRTMSPLTSRASASGDPRLACEGESGWRAPAGATLTACAPDGRRPDQSRRRRLRMRPPESAATASRR